MNVAHNRVYAKSDPRQHSSLANMSTREPPLRLRPPLQLARRFHHFLFAAPSPACCVQGIATSYSCPPEARFASDPHARCVMSGQRLRPQLTLSTNPANVPTQGHVLISLP
ncbi:hypothetical protein M3J09_001760 [Ascochyta lentis]